MSIEIFGEPELPEVPEDLDQVESAVLEDPAFLRGIGGDFGSETEEGKAEGEATGETT